MCPPYSKGRRAWECPPYSNGDGRRVVSGLKARNTVGDMGREVGCVLGCGVLASGCVRP